MVKCGSSYRLYFFCDFALPLLRLSGPGVCDDRPLIFTRRRHLLSNRPGVFQCTSIAYWVVKVSLHLWVLFTFMCRCGFGTCRNWYCRFLTSVYRWSTTYPVMLHRIGVLPHYNPVFPLLQNHALCRTHLGLLYFDSLRFPAYDILRWLYVVGLVRLGTSVYRRGTNGSHPSSLTLHLRLSMSQRETPLL